jgi:DhnA family fructose-bisphosphate aldolase class Ia
LYDGSAVDPAVFAEFGRVVEHAHDYGIPVIAWMYPRSAHEHNTDRDAYAARLALELGADAVGLRFSGDVHALSWVVKCAGKTAVFVVEGSQTSAKDLLAHARTAMHAGACGVVHGKTVWSHAKPFSLTRAMHSVVFKDKTVDEAMKYLE